MDVVLALDIGGTNTRLALFSTSDGAEVRRTTIPTQADNYATALRSIMDAAHKLKLVGNDEIIAVGAGVAAKIDNGVVGKSGNLGGWEGKRFRTHLERRLRVPVAVLNDCAAAALGEYSALNEPLIYVIWGTRVGVAVVELRDRQVYVRPTELGHMIIDPHSMQPCGCGGYGHLEAYVGGGSMIRLFGAEGPELNVVQWRKVLIYMAAGLRTLSMGDMGLPIVLGGGVAHSPRHPVNELRPMVNKLAATCNAPKLLEAQHGADSGLVGASYAARQLVGLV